jgi:hypothetical protein
VKAAPRFYTVPGRHGSYLITWAYVSAWMVWCWRLLQGLFPLRSFSSGVIKVDLGSASLRGSEVHYG